MANQSAVTYMLPGAWTPKKRCGRWDTIPVSINCSWQLDDSTGFEDFDAALTAASPPRERPGNEKRGGILRLSRHALRLSRVRRWRCMRFIRSQTA